MRIVAKTQIFIKIWQCLTQKRMVDVEGWVEDDSKKLNSLILEIIKENVKK